MLSIVTCILGIIYLTGNHNVGTWLAICAIATFVCEGIIIILRKISGRK